MSCSYCNSPNHSIISCPVDNEIINIMYCHEAPKFESFSQRFLKKLASICEIKTSQTKRQIVFELYEKFKQLKETKSTTPYENIKYIKNEKVIYTKNGNSLEAVVIDVHPDTDEEFYTIQCGEYEKQTTKKHIQKWDSGSSNTDCPICLDPLGSVNVCSTSCGHKFHLSCMMRCKQNACPLCRKQIVDYPSNFQENHVPIERTISYDELDDHDIDETVRSTVLNYLQQYVSITQS